MNKYTRKASGKAKNIADRLNHRGVFGITHKWTKWAKRYLSKASRRNKNEIN